MHGLQVVTEKVQKCLMMPMREQSLSRPHSTGTMRTGAATTGAAASFLAVLTCARGERTPNILILFADNLAYNDVGAFSHNKEQSNTPSLDALASSGRKLLNWNSPAVLCSASRAALLTGRYPIRTGIYPRVFEPDAVHGLLPNETTLAEYLHEEGYATKIVGKWHLGHAREEFLPTNQGFDEWFGIPYHMSGGSVDDHVCGRDVNGTMWLPLFQGTDIVEQPVALENLAPRYVDESIDFMKKTIEQDKPFFLYLAFSHVHQLCAPRHAECQWASNHFSKQDGYNATFGGAVQEMDWIAGRVLDYLRDVDAIDDTFIIFTSDNGPWVAEGSCAGSKGQFEGRWLKDNVDLNCTACPSEYIPAPTESRPRRCIYPGTDYEVDGVHCGEDTGLGSAWEANVRMPGIVRWPNGGVPPGTVTMDMVSTLDVVPTILSVLGRDVPNDIDGVDVSSVFFGDDDDRPEKSERLNNRTIFFWRDGFSAGQLPLPKPFGRFDVVAMKMRGRYKLWFSTKSSHYNDDAEVYHDPPLIFDVIDDPAEATALDPTQYTGMIESAKAQVAEHKTSVDWTHPLCLARDPKYLPCAEGRFDCRTTSMEAMNVEVTQIKV